MSDYEGRASGVIATAGSPSLPDAYERGAKRKRMRGLLALNLGQKAEGEKLLRQSLEDFVNAFLFDRHGHAHCFAEAHQLGREISTRIGCPLTQKSPTHWNIDCGVLALHSRLGLSFGGATWGRCTLCGAEDFECDHVPGQSYDGIMCEREIHRVELEEVSLVQFPDDPRCYRVTTDRHIKDIEASMGEPLPEDAVPTCEHCVACPGTPIAEDIDQSLWPAIEPQSINS